MNQFFSFRRFRLLVLKHWGDNIKRYGLSVLAFTGLLIAWFVFTMLVADDILMPLDVQQATYFLMLFAAGTFYASQYFRHLGSRARGINFLLVPASSFEKFLCSFLYTVVLFFVVFTAAFYLVDLLMISIANSVAENNQTQKTTMLNVFNVNLFSFNSDRTLNFLLFFFSVQSAFLLGSVYFRRYNYIKTVISGFIVYMVFPVGYFIYMRFIYKGGGPDQPMEMPDSIANGICLLVYAIAPLLWILAYYKLKQKQVSA